MDSFVSVSSDHRPIFLSIRDASENEKGPSYWKFNATLRFDSEYDSLLRESYADWRREYAEFEKQLRWDLEKYQIRKITTEFSKKKARLRREAVKKLEKTINAYETNPTANNIAPEGYSAAKQAYEEIKNDEAIGSILRSKCQVYEDGEKSSKYFAGLEKTM